MTKLRLGLMTTLLCACAFPAMAQNHNHHAHHGHHNHQSAEPLAVMGGHVHDKGDWMLSYRYMTMHMEGNRDGTDRLSAEDIVTNFSNPNAPPAGFRVVPTKMTMDMHMLGAMYAPTDWLTLMAMGNYVEKDMDHITFQGMTGTTRLGTFNVKTSGWGDTKLAGLFRLYNHGNHSVHLNAGVSLPTGSIDEEARVLAPNNTTPLLRTPYAMQLGTGTFDALPGITYTGHSGTFGWGAQYSGEIRMESENSEGYSWGDKHKLSLWGSHQATDWLALNVSANAATQDKIDGSDPLIAAPVQTADPSNYGGHTVAIGTGFQITPGQALKNVKFGAEISVPIYQDLNGPQMETDWIATGGLKVTF